MRWSHHDFFMEQDVPCPDTQDGNMPSIPVYFLTHPIPTTRTVRHHTIPPVFKTLIYSKLPLQQKTL